ncbi:hypothetical protein SAMN04487765_1286 [Tenacibaculum sp. MAR_2010_89]|uniref:hypothetical protein n=1 Tax=Tenacibaculum sp. MAR_2010_89 TaxID=1250198 RepID=UPI0008990CB1|nr:hypothetical protein [Tenacibaculum sp. MAR_2010_89]SEE06925.1 hypothetical protein SAMN04487765_1286 [Tenacibaculum sp. MAR_2010_89]
MKKIMLSIFTMLVCVLGNAQELPKIVPPAPTAFELTKYGDFPVGLNTGVTGVNLPIQAYKTRNLNVPISLSYSSSGIKVDQLSSNVGLGWSLNIGGVIARTVRGKEDENYRLEHPVKEINRVDLYQIESLSSQPTFSENIDVDPDIVSFLYNAGKTDYVDSESDMFSYNMLGKSGKIVIDNEGVYRTVPHTNLKIERNLISGQKGFVITTDDGVAYYFNDEEILYSRNKCNNTAASPPEQGYTSSWYLSKIVHPKGDIINFVYDTNNKEESYTTSISQSLELTSTYPIGNSNFPLTTGIIDCENFNRVIRKRLIEINSNQPQSGKLLIDNSTLHPSPSAVNYRLIKNIQLLDQSNNLIDKTDFTYHFSSNKRVFLENLTFKNPQKKFSFAYDDFNAFPKRFSYSQDYWGYYNGKTNQSMLPDLGESYPVFAKQTSRLANRNLDTVYSKKGLLTKIVYPSMGYTNFEYEGNNYYGYETELNYEYKPGLTIVGEQIKSSTFTIGDYNAGKNVEIGLNYQVKGYVNSSQGCYDYPLDKANAIIKIYDITNGSNNLVYEKGFNTTQGSINFSTITNLPHSKSYRIEILNGSYTPNRCVDASVSLRIKKYTTSYKNIFTGGNRVKYIRNYDFNTDILNTKRYYYTDMNDLTKSSGDATIKGLGHVQGRTAFKDIGSLGSNIVSESYLTLRSTGSFPLTNSGSSNVYYKKVTISNGGDDFINGGEEHEFIVNRDSPGETLLGANRVIANFTNFGWNHGLEKKIQFFKKPLSKSSTKTVVKEITNNYKLDRTVSEISNYNISSNYNIVVMQPAYPTYKCKAADLIGTTPVWQCHTNHSHAISGPGWLDPVTYYSSTSNGKGPVTIGQIKCKSPGATNIKIRDIKHKCFGKNVNDLVSFPQIIRNLNVHKYKTYSYWSYLDKTIEKQFDINGNNPITNTINYFYDNINHLQQTRVEKTNSKGEVLKTKMYYPDDKSQLLGISPGALKAIDSLKKQHRIATLIQTESYKNVLVNSETGQRTDKKLGTQRTNFKDWGNGIVEPNTIQTAKGNGNLEPRIVYHKYDSKGNPTEVSKVNGTHIVYLWGMIIRNL